MDYVVRLHLKTGTDFRQGLVDFCLNSKKQYVAIGWSGQSEDLSARAFKSIIAGLKSCLEELIQQLTFLRMLK